MTAHTTTYKGILAETRNRVSVEKITSRSMMLVVSGDGVGATFFITTEDLYRIWKIIGNAIDEAQPGVINPLPDGDPAQADAIRFIQEAV